MHISNDKYLIILCIQWKSRYVQLLFSLESAENILSIAVITALLRWECDVCDLMCDVAERAKALTPI